MGSSVEPLLANIFVSRFDSELGSFSKFCFRYVDDVIRTLRTGGEKYLLDFVNTMHEHLKFTLEQLDNNNSIVFLDMKIIRHQDGRLTSSWYRKLTDTVVLLNFHSLGPDLYKRYLIAGIIHRIFMTTSNWTLFGDSLLEAHGILQNNQYPKHFIQRVTNFTLSNIVSEKNSLNKSKYETVKPNFSTVTAACLYPALRLDKLYAALIRCLVLWTVTKQILIFLFLSIVFFGLMGPMRPVESPGIPLCTDLDPT